MQQPFTLGAGVAPTLVVRPEDIFEGDAAPQTCASTQSAPMHTAAAAAPPAVVAGERYDSSFADGAAAAQPWRPQWSSQAALWQLRLALGDAPRLRDGGVCDAVPPGTACASAAHTHCKVAAPASTSPATALDTYRPPLIRMSTAPSSSAAASSSYVRTALTAIQDECDAVLRDLEEALPASRRAGAAREASASALPTTTEAELEEFTAAQLTCLLQAPATVAQLRQRADAAVMEREHAFQLQELVDAELRQRRLVPLATSSTSAEGADDVGRALRSLCDLVAATETALDRYAPLQGVLHALSPLMETGLAVAECLNDVSVTAAPAARLEMEALRNSMAALGAQAVTDAALLQRNALALQHRVAALQRG